MVENVKRAREVNTDYFDIVVDSFDELKGYFNRVIRFIKVFFKKYLISVIQI